MKLKRITAALLAGVMCVGLLAGCGNDTAGTKDKSTKVQAIRLRFVC